MGAGSAEIFFVDKVRQLRHGKMAESIDYKGYRLEVSAVLKGWRTSIYPPGSKSALAESPSTLETCPKQEIVAEAKRIIDARLNSRSA
jgi:hypothetical protein